MYKISNNIIHVNKSKYLTPATETQTHGSHDHAFKYFLEHASNDVFKYSYFPRTVREWNSLSSDIVSAKSWDIFKSMLSDYLVWGDPPPAFIYLFIIIIIFLFFFY